MNILKLNWWNCRPPGRDHGEPHRPAPALGRQTSRPNIPAYSLIETDHEIGCPIRQLSGVVAGAVPVAIDSVVMMGWWLVAPVVASTMIRTCQKHSPRIFHVLTC